MSNRFLKLFVLSPQTGTPLFLYGFSSPTEQPPLPWQCGKSDRSAWNGWSAILTESEASDLESQLTQSGIVQVGKMSMPSPCLRQRPAVLANEGRTEHHQHGPVTMYRKLTEFWSIQKRTLFQQVKGSFSSTGKSLYLDILALCDWLKSECGVDFLKEGHRFGNYERYDRSAQSYRFDMVIHKECGLQKATVTKCQPVDEDLIVNYAAEHRGRWLFNQLRPFPAKQKTIEFFSEEPMSRLFVQIWTHNSGELVYTKDLTLIMGVSLRPNWSSASRVIQDPWSKKLRQASRNHEDEVEKKVERVERFSPDKLISIRSQTYSELDAAMEEGAFIFSPFRRERTRGAFVPKMAANGEIDSFLKIRSYLENRDLDRAVIVDPYFSVEAAAKLLARIENTSLQIDIITSLGGKDPDTGEAADAVEKCRRFLNMNVQLLHNKLHIYNLSRGKDPVFHDRYLIRIYKNGAIDGFLLSNSLNAAGAFYPFVTAPLEWEVCLDICDYLHEMCSKEVQSKFPKHQQITCEVLFEPPPPPAPPEIEPYNGPTLHSWLTEWCSSAHNSELEARLASAVPDSRLPLKQEDLLAVTAAIQNHWPQETDNVLRVLGDTVANSYPWPLDDLIKHLQNLPDFFEAYLTLFLKSAEEIERQQDHARRGVDSEEYHLWALLHGGGEAHRQGLRRFFEQYLHIWYPNSGHLYGNYRILLRLEPERYLSEMLRLSSPMMFSVIIGQMWDEWVPTLYYGLTNLDIRWLQALAAEWLIRYVERASPCNEWIFDVLSPLSPSKCALQSVYLLSSISFMLRTMHKMDETALQQWISLKAALFRLAADALQQCTQDEITGILYWLFEPEPYSEAHLYFDLATTAEEGLLRQFLLQHAASVIETALLKSTHIGNRSQLIELYLKNMNLLYGEQMESRILGKLVSWEVFVLAAEPERENYDFHRWHEACKRAEWQMEMLMAYKESHPGAEKTLHWIDTWRPQLSKMLNDAAI